jgi:hypothetical protein
MSEPARPEINCPFYGRHLAVTDTWAGTHIPKRIMFLAHPSNQCALIKDDIVPCRLSVEGKPVDWSTCPTLAEHVVQTGTT